MLGSLKSYLKCQAWGLSIFFWWCYLSVKNRMCRKEKTRCEFSVLWSKSIVLQDNLWTMCGSANLNIQNDLTQSEKTALHFYFVLSTPLLIKITWRLQIFLLCFTTLHSTRHNNGLPILLMRYSLGLISFRAKPIDLWCNWSETLVPSWFANWPGQRPYFCSLLVHHQNFLGWCPSKSRHSGHWQYRTTTTKSLHNF